MLDEYKKNLNICLSSDNLDMAGQLIEGFHKLGYEPDAECLYYESAFHYYSGNYAMALYYADMCFIRFPDYEPVYELIGYLTGHEGDFSSYTPSFTKDVSSYNKRLNIMASTGFLPIVDYTVELFAKILRYLGHNVTLVDMVKTDEGYTCPVGINLAASVDMLYEFNNMGIVLKDSKGNDYFEQKKIPVYSYMFDHPMFFADEFTKITSNVISMCTDRNHIKYINRFYPEVKDSLFIPLGSEEKPGNIIEWEKRPIQCLYVGSLKEAPKHLEDEFSDIVFEFQKENTSYTTEAAIEKCYRELSDDDYKRIFPDVSKKYPKKRLDDDFLLRMNAHYCFCDLKINSFFRKKLVEVLVEAGIDVWVYGKGWEDPKLMNNPCFHFGGLISQDECIEKMHETKYILNSMPWFKDGTHDRIYNACLAGGLCVTDISKYLSEEYTDGEDIVYYDLDHMEKLPEIIRYYDSHPELIQPMLDRAYEKTVLKHSWTNRVIDILEHYFVNFDS